MSSRSAIACKHISRQNTAYDIAKMRYIVHVGQGGRYENVPLSLLWKNFDRWSGFAVTHGEIARKECAVRAIVSSDEISLGETLHERTLGLSVAAVLCQRDQRRVEIGKSLMR